MKGKCMAHGDEDCADCARISAEYLIEGPACRDCGTFGETGMHWDSCAGRIRRPITAPGAVEPAPDMVASPPHYTSHPSGIQPITITRHESFCLGNVLKYCMRAKYKGHEIQDLRKAAQYLQWEIERLEAKS